MMNLDDQGFREFITKSGSKTSEFRKIQKEKRFSVPGRVWRPIGGSLLRKKSRMRPENRTRQRVFVASRRVARSALWISNRRSASRLAFHPAADTLRSSRSG